MLRDQRRPARRLLDVVLRRRLHVRLCPSRTGRRIGRLGPWPLLRGSARAALAVDCRVHGRPRARHGCGVVRAAPIRAQANGRDADSVAALRNSVCGVFGPAGPVRSGGASGIRRGAGFRALPRGRAGVVCGLRRYHRGPDAGARGDRAAVRPRRSTGHRGPRWGTNNGHAQRCAGSRHARRLDRGGSRVARPSRHRVPTVFGGTAPNDAQPVGDDHVLSDARAVCVWRATESNRLSRLGVPQRDADLRLRNP